MLCSCNPLSGCPCVSGDEGALPVPKDELYESLTASSTTRRTIVKTGAKLAYAVPAVAATMKLSAMGAGAAVVSGGTCTPSETCGSGPSGCDGSDICSCGSTAGGGVACFQWGVGGSGGSCAGT